MRERFSWIVKAAFLLPVILTFFCSSNDGSPATTKIYKKDNITYIENAASPNITPRIYKLEETISIGNTGDDENYILVRPSPPRVDNNGNIYTMDHKRESVFAYNGKGEFLRQFGRRGQGPGESVNMRDFAVDNHNGMLLIMDAKLNKISRFLLDGSYYPEVKIEKHPFRLFAAGKDAYYVVHSIYDEKDTKFYAVIKYSPDGRKLATSPRLSCDKYIRLQIGTGTNIRNTIIKSSFCARSIFSLSPDGDLYRGMSDEYRIEAYDTDLQIVKVIEKAVSERISVTIEEKEQQLDSLKGNMTNRGNTPVIVDSSILDRIPDHYPVYFSFWFDDEKRLWVPLVSRDEQVQNIDIFDSNGVFNETRSFKKPAGILTILDIFGSPVIRGDLLYALVRDSEENPFIKVYRMVKLPEAKGK